MIKIVSKGLFTWSGGPRSSGVGFFCFHALGHTKQKKPTPLNRGFPLHVNRVLITKLQLSTFTNREREFRESVEMVFGEGKHKHRST